MNWNNSFTSQSFSSYNTKHMPPKTLSEGIRKEQAKLQKEAERQRRADEKQLAKERNTERLRALIERLKENEKKKEMQKNSKEKSLKQKELKK